MTHLSDLVHDSFAALIQVRGMDPAELPPPQVLHHRFQSFIARHHARRGRRGDRPHRRERRRLRHRRARRRDRPRARRAGAHVLDDPAAAARDLQREHRGRRLLHEARRATRKPPPHAGSGGLLPLPAVRLSGPLPHARRRSAARGDHPGRRAGPPAQRIVRRPTRCRREGFRFARVARRRGATRRWWRWPWSPRCARWGCISGCGTLFGSRPARRSSVFNRSLGNRGSEAWDATSSRSC